MFFHEHRGEREIEFGDLHRSGHHLVDDEEADEAVYPRMKAMRRMLGTVKELAGSHSLDVSTRQHDIAELFKNARLVYGPEWHEPEQIGDEAWLILQTGNSLERVQGLQALLEPHGYAENAGVETSSEHTVSPELPRDENQFSFSLTPQEPELNTLEISPNTNTEKKDEGDDDVTFYKKTPI